MSEIRISEILAPAFWDLACAVFDHKYTHYWLDGGRGSTKSSCVSILIPLLLITHPNTHAVVMRKVGNTMRDSVYAQIQWGIETLGLLSFFRFTVSPMEITYLPTGQKIMFRGADDKMKIKSIKPPFGYIACGWYEELDQFFGMEEIRSINQSLMRGGPEYWIFYTYNPPKSRDNWVNVEVLEEREERLQLHTTYLDVPAQWLGEDFIREAEHLKSRSPLLYAHEYLGEVTGTGGAVFENLKEREITDAEIAGFGRFEYGLDFGFAIDPLAWCKLHYDPKRRILYILDEICEQKLTNRKAAERIRAKGSGHIWADSAEPKSIEEMKAFGLHIDGAEKGPDSVEYGLKWLQNLEAIVIDKRRAPHAFKEFSLYEYERNREGEFISCYPDKNNHLIDAVRYALCKVMRYNVGWGTSKVKGF